MLWFLIFKSFGMFTIFTIFKAYSSDERTIKIVKIVKNTFLAMTPLIMLWFSICKKFYNVYDFYYFLSSFRVSKDYNKYQKS